MKRFVPLVLALCLLASCADTNKGSKSVTVFEKTPLGVPTSCKIPGVISAFQNEIPGASYIPTQWQPAQGTDLYRVINSGGIACTYGLQSAEIGGTVMWAPNRVDMLTSWLKDGQVEIEIPGVEEDYATILPEGSTSADGMHRWSINLKIRGVWIQVSGSFLDNVEEATPIIKAAVGSLTA